MIVRMILFAAIAWLVWRFFDTWQQKLRGPQQPPPSQKPEQPPFELMQRCTGCGAYLPSTALSRSGRCGRCSD